MKNILCILCLIGLTFDSFSQQVNEGLFNDWDFGPHGVYGNLSLLKITNRKYFKIEKSGTQSAKVYEFNPSGIVTRTISVSFAKGIIDKITEIDQWGEVIDIRTFSQTGSNEFKVTDLAKGVNNYLPCKYAKYTYNNELLIEGQFYSFTDQVKENSQGIAIVRYKRYDDKLRFGEIKEMSFFDAKGNPVISKKAGFHKVLYEYDVNDNKISERYFGIDNEIYLNRNTNIAGLNSYYDSDNNLIKSENIGINNHVMSNVYGVAIVEFEYLKGYRIKLIYLDTALQVARTYAYGNGLAMITYEYDTKGNLLKESYFDPRGNPTTNQSGVHQVVNTFSSSNMVVEESYYDDFEKPSLNRDKVHKIIYIRDVLGRIIQVSNYDIENKPVKDVTSEVFLKKYKYSDFGLEISRSYWRDSISKMPTWDGTYETISKYDKDGQIEELILLDENGQQLKNKIGFSTTQFIRGNDGRLSQRKFLFENKPVIRLKGVTKDYSIINYDYDEDGKVKQLTFLGIDSKPVDATIWFNDSFPAHKIVFVYKGNRIVEQKFYLKNGEDPVRIVDCLKSDFIASSGINIGRKIE